MIDIKILFILPNKLEEIKNYFVEISKDSAYSINYTSTKGRLLSKQIKDSDIHIFLFDNEIGSLTKEMIEKFNQEYCFFAFNKNNQTDMELNDITPDAIRSHKNIASIKKSLIDYDEYTMEQDSLKNLQTNIESYITKTVEKLLEDEGSTYLEAIKIKDYFSIKEEIIIDDLKGKKEIYFVGENGDGKTVLLQAILLALKNGGNKYSIHTEDYIKDIKQDIILSTKDEKDNLEYKKYKNIKNVFAYGINRNKYDSDEADKDGYSGIFETPLISIKLRKPQDLLRHNSILIEEFIINLENLMSNKLKIIKEKDEDEVYFQEINEKPIDFKMLSEGYKSTIIWLCDLLSRLMENQTTVEKLEDFQAIVLVDEIDLYLHPKWRYDFVFKLRQIFPKIQFIMTTHSIVTILGATNDEKKETAFYKIYKEDGNTKITNQIDDISSYTANILITSPLFDLDRVTVRGFKDERLGSDDYIYSEIHQSVREYMKNNPSSLDDKVKEEVKAQLKERLANLRKK